MSNLLRQTRPAKAGEDGNGTSVTEPPAVMARTPGHAPIDSTGAKTAQIKAALTVVMSRLGSEPTPERARAVATPAPRSGASDALRVLDSYAADPLRLSA